MLLPLIIFPPYCREKAAQDLQMTLLHICSNKLRCALTMLKYTKSGFFPYLPALIMSGK